MNGRKNFPFDLTNLLSAPIVFGGIAVVTSLLFPIFNWLRHPTPSAWLWALGLASGTAVAGVVLLLVAKLPQYRAGVFLRIGSRALPAREQQLYRVAWLLLLPSIMVLLALYGTVHRVL